MEGKTQEAAAAAAGMSVRSSRKWEDGPLPSETKGVRTWRTRKDPFEEVWETEIVPLLEADKEGKLEAKAVLEHLMLKQPAEFHEGQARTLQRRFRDWRALHGPDREVFFEQDHPPGQQGNLDFTEADELGVTIRGEVFAHLLFVFRLAYSGWTWATIAFTETFEALVEGLQGALWDLGGTPSGIRHDPRVEAGSRTRLNKRWVAVLDHYGAKPLRIKPRHSHQNGIAEKGHDLLKRRLEQALEPRLRHRRCLPGVRSRASGLPLCQAGREGRGRASRPAAAAVLPRAERAATRRTFSNEPEDVSAAATATVIVIQVAT